MTAPALNQPDEQEERPVIWAPFPGMQTEFLAAKQFEILAGGAKGPGKTDLLVIKRSDGASSRDA